MKRISTEKLLFIAAIVLTALTPIALSPFTFRPFQTGKIVFFLVVMAVVAPILIYTLFKKSESTRVLKHPITIALGAILLIQIITSFFGVDPYNSFVGNSARPGGIILNAFLLLFFLLLTHVFTHNAKRTKVLLTMGGVITVTAAYGILEAFGWLPSLAPSFVPRASSTYGNPIFFANVLLIPLAFSLLWMQGKRTPYRFIVPAIFVGGILASGTRGTLVALLVAATGGAFWYLLKSEQTKAVLKKWTPALLVLIALIATSGLLARQYAPKDSIGYRLTHFQTATTSERMLLWGIATNGIAAKPIIGYGYENFYRAGDQLYDQRLYAMGGTWPDKPHNLLLEYAINGGVILLLAYLWLFYATFKALTQKASDFTRLEQTILLSALIGYLVQALFIFETISATLIFMFLLAYIQSRTLSEQTIATNKPITVSASLGAAALSIASLMLVTVPLHQQMDLQFQIDHGKPKTPEHQAETLLKGVEQSHIYDPSMFMLKYYETTNGLLHADIDPEVKKTLLTKGMERFATTIQKQPLSAQTYYNYVLFLQMASTRLDDPTISEKQQQATNELEQLAPNRREAIIARSQYYVGLGELDRAIEEAEKAYFQEPPHSKSAVNLGMLYLQAERIEDAAPLILFSVQKEVQFNNPTALAIAGSHYARTNQFKEAAYLYEHILRIDPSQFHVLSSLAATYASMGEYEKARAAAKTLIKLDPSSKEAAEAFLATLPN